MSKLLQRIGSKARKITFKITIHYVHIEVQAVTLLKVTWQKHAKVSETAYYIKVDENIRRGECEETLVMENTLYYKNNKYLKKDCKLIIFDDSNGTSKEIGRINLTLNDFIENPGHDIHVPIVGNSDKDAEIVLSITAEPGSFIGSFIGSFKSDLDYLENENYEDTESSKEVISRLREKCREQALEIEKQKKYIKELEGRLGIK